MAGAVTARKRAPRKPRAEVEVFDPAYEAHCQRVAGRSWREVAEATGYPNELACRAAVTTYLTRAASALNKEQQAERLAVELDRLDAVQKAFWSATMMGDEKAATVVLNVIRTRSKLLGLETKENEAAVTRTVLIAGNTEEYVAGLRALVDADDQAD
jgi:hypothetical protein